MSNFYGATSLIGGTSGALDKIDGANLASGDGALVITSTGGYIHYLDAASGATESSPNIISPDSNAGNKRWILVAIVSKETVTELLKLYDTDKTHTLSVKWNENDTGDRVLNLLVSGANRTLTITGDSTINQSVATGASPTFVGATLSGLTASRAVLTDASKNLVSDDAATGTGAPVRATSPTLVTPALGTPASGNLSNCTAATTSAKGVVELATDAETLTGTSDAVVVTPGNLTARLASVARSIGGQAYVDILGCPCPPSLDFRMKDWESEANGYPSNVTFDRASIGTRVNALGLIESMGSGVLRHDYDPVTGEYLGVLIEAAMTNSALHSRDLSNAAWTKTDCTGVQDAVGMDGVTDSASTLTADDADATCLQALTIASAAFIFCPYVKRKTGTGAVSITIDGGTSWTAITDDISTTAWTRVTVTDTLANPSVGFKLATNGDEIEVDFCDCQNGTFVTSPIPTEGATVTRNADALSMTGADFSAWYSQDEGLYYVECKDNYAATLNSRFVAISDGTNDNRIIGPFHTSLGVFTHSYAVVATSGQTSIVIAGTTSTTMNKVAIGFNASGRNVSANGSETNTAGTMGAMPVVDRLILGGSSNGTVKGSNHIRQFTYFPKKLSTTLTQTLTK